MQSSNELEKLLAKIEELEAQIPVSTDPAERTAMRNVLVAMLQ
jgi:BMFP domain-containing protein YqiC